MLEVGNYGATTGETLLTSLEQQGPNQTESVPHGKKYFLINLNQTKKVLKWEVIQSQIKSEQDQLNPVA